MVRVAVCFLLICGVFALVSAARAGDLFEATIPLRNGQLLVVAESDLEPRSVGSYSLRLYSNERPEFPYDRFLAGGVYHRDGVLEAALELDPKHCEDCFMICMRSVGTGGYLSRHIFSYANNRLVLHYEETIGCATGLSCTDAGESRWEWPESGSERSSGDSGD